MAAEVSCDVTRTKVIGPVAEFVAGYRVDLVAMWALGPEVVRASDFKRFCFHAREHEFSLVVDFNGNRMSGLKP
jgi:hypothetical protein